MTTLWIAIQKFVSLLFLATVCVSCYQDNDLNYIPDIKAYAFYVTIEEPELKKPDANAKVYYYSRTCEDDFGGYGYQEDGIFVKENFPTITPDEIFLIGSDGSVVFIPEDTKGGAVVVIESNYYKGRIKMTSFASPQNGAGTYTVFKPE